MGAEPGGRVLRTASNIGNFLGTNDEAVERVQLSGRI